MLNRLSLQKKFLIVVISSVIASIALLTMLIIKRDTLLLQADHKKNAEVVIASISKALKNNMLGGRPEETERLIQELSHLEGVNELAVMKPDGAYAFEKAGPALRIEKGLMARLRAGEEISMPFKGITYFMRPLLNEKPCRLCHTGSEAIRGVVIVSMSSTDIDRNILDLVKRMSLFGILTALVLSGMLTFLSRRMLLLPIKGLTDAVTQVAFGKFVLYRARGSRCNEMLDCNKANCPSYDDATIPCWLQSGTLCKGEPSGQFALKYGDCLKCEVYKELKGDEMVQMQDNFNRMSLTLKKNKEDTKRHIQAVESLNQELTKSNTKLRTLLEASRLTASTLELEETLSSTLKIILDVTNLKVGVILLLEEDPTKKCYEFFDCNALNCPAYRADINCWRLSGTMCHGDDSLCPGGLTPIECWEQRRTHTHLMPARDYDQKFYSCSNCAFFANIVLIPKMVSGFTDGRLGERLNLDSSTIHKALLMGHTLVNYSNENPFNIPIDTITELAMPLKVKEQITGVLYLASDIAHQYTKDEIAFFQFLSEIISSGIFNSRLFEDVETSYFQTVMALANAVEAKDPYTRGHSERVADLCMKAADALRLSKQEKEHLRFAAILHDVGKIGISRELLRKKSHLDELEENEIRSHTESGVQILEPVHFLKPALPAIRHHHERFDGTGYPLGLKGKEIPFKARIICVADAWDAMLSTRPYRDALSIEVAIKELKKNTGTQFDPEIADFFVRLSQEEKI